jgi:valine--pyruvate aminotransferase
MKVSRFGQKICNRSGISQLMVDMGEGLKAGDDVLMLGGGNPAHIPAIEKVFREQMIEIFSRKGEFERLIGDYDSPQGSSEFIKAVCELLRAECGWKITPANIALTTGSQSAFFILFNIFGGQYEDGVNKKILLPLAPEYTGYCDVGLAGADKTSFVANRPEIEHIDKRTFKYHINFERLTVGDDIGAICVSRPTNPTSNVLTDSEIGKLNTIALAKDIPLIIDNAYGPPFPNIIFTEAKPFWNANTIVCMSLSKFGLPATRTGIVIAREEIIELVSEANAVMSLSTPGLGACIATELVRTGEIIRLSRDVIKPYYQEKAEMAVSEICGLLDDVDFHIHKPEGAFFLWLWLPELMISDVELYQRLKKRGVLIVPGHYFFPGLKNDCPPSAAPMVRPRPQLCGEAGEHKHQCIRISYAQDIDKVRAGLKIIAGEIKLACK